MTRNQAKELEKRIIGHPNDVIVVHDPKTAYELQFVYGIPGARICVLQSLEPGKAVIMNRTKYKRFLKKERDIIANAENTN